MNKFLLMGNLTKDPEFTKNESEEKRSFTRLTVAVKKSNDVTDFIDATAFGKTAETIAKYFKKGDKILLEGAIGTFKKDGELTRLTLSVSSFEFCERRQAKENPVSEEEKEDADLPF